ncbi:CoA transferase [Exilibacterium tricleocarpae]|uniref:CoA transferase n=1 Tax=Exilibacterium tricleocarpae TaxID=2591008 RepID=A0A545SXJ5_9GAMM|nr:CaiB/BaiF CoA-transferase family protein [Exilibacterium tricleocarpae]TQV69686.1 CoA transferase [Exilibacterium tricleocarpae]
MSQPLNGLKILDFTTLLPGPYATQLLADMGADVLRVEAHTRPDMVRFTPPYIDDGAGGQTSAAHATLNRNKKSVALDLKQPEAIAVVHKLLASYDIVIEQFRPGVMARLGLDYDSLAAVNPQLIYCSVSGYGQSGPLRDRAGHDINYLALAGLASFSGREETGPVLSGTQIADIAGGTHHAVMGILAAVIQRQTSGVGQHIDISMSDAALALTTLFGAGYLADGRVPGLSTEVLNGGIFYGYHRTRDGRYFSVGSLEPQFTQQLFAAIGKPEWAERSADPSPEAQRQLRDDVRAVFLTRSFAEWKDIFARCDACIEPVLRLDEVERHPHFQARGMFVDVPGNAGGCRQIASPIKFSASAPDYRSIGRPLGADTEAVLKDCGYTDDEIAALRAAGVVG